MKNRKRNENGDIFHVSAASVSFFRQKMCEEKNISRLEIYLLVPSPFLLDTNTHVPKKNNYKCNAM